MRRSLALKLSLLTLVLATACVTINVYFPAAEAQKAADQIIDGVLGSDAKPSKSNTTPTPSSSLYQRTEQLLIAAAGKLLELVIPSAHAQGADLNVNTPAIRQITQSMEARHASLKPYYDSGAVGFAKDGLIDVRDQNAIPLPDRNTAKRLVSDENSDRGNLYREIAKANNHPEWEADIRRTFAQRWIDKAASGWYYQDASGAWQRK